MCVVSRANATTHQGDQEVVADRAAHASVRQLDGALPSRRRARRVGLQDLIVDVEVGDVVHERRRAHARAPRLAQRVAHEGRLPAAEEAGHHAHRHDGGVVGVAHATSPRAASGDWGNEGGERRAWAAWVEQEKDGGRGRCYVSYSLRSGTKRSPALVSKSRPRYMNQAVTRWRFDTCAPWSSGLGPIFLHRASKVPTLARLNYALPRHPSHHHPCRRRRRSALTHACACGDRSRKR